MNYSEEKSKRKSGMDLFNEISAKYGVNNNEGETLAQKVAKIPLTSIAGNVSKEEPKRKNGVDLFDEISAKYGVKTNVDDAYIESFFSDANNFLGSAEEELKNIGWSNASSAYSSRSETRIDLDTRAYRIKRWLEDNKSKIDEKSYNSMYSALTDYDKYSKSVIDGFKGAKDYFGQFKSENEYNGYIIGWNDVNTEYITHDYVAKRQEMYQANKTRIAEIEKELGNFNGDFEKQQALIKERNDLEAQNTTYDRLQGKADKYVVPETEEFLANASYRDYTNAGFWDLLGYDSNLADIYNKIANGCTIDENYNVVNMITGEIEYEADELTKAVATNSVPQLYDSAVQDKLGLYLGASQGQRLEATNKYENNNTWASILKEGVVERWDLLTEGEINTYYNLMKTQGKGAAYKYLSDMETILEIRSQQAFYEDVKEAGFLKKLFYNVLSVPANVVGGAIGLVEDVSNLVQGEEINPYSAAHGGTNFANIVRQATAEDIVEMTGGASLPTGFTWGDAYQSAMSFADMAFGSLFGGGGKPYAMLMASSAAESEMKRLWESGASTGQMVLGGLTSAAAEYVFEKYSIENFINMKDPKTILDVVTNTLKQAGIEASEEMATELTNKLSNAIIMGTQSDWAKSRDEFIAKGYSESEATWMALREVAKDVLNAGIGGALSGGLGAGLSSTAGKVVYNANATQAGKDIIADGGVDTLKQLAFDMAEEQSGYNGVKRFANKTTSENAKRVGMLYDKMSDSVKKQDIADIKTALAENGYSKKDIKTVVEAYNEGKELSDVFKDAEKVKTIQSIIDNTVFSPKSAATERNAKLLLASRGVEIKKTTPTAEKTASTEGSPKQEVELVKVSENGKTMLGDTEVSIKEIASVKDGKVTLRLEDDSTVDAMDVEFGSNDEGLLYENVIDMGLNAVTANAFVNGYDGTISVAEYAGGFKQAYTYGELGIPKSELNAEGFAPRLTASQKETAYNHGSINAKYKATEQEKANKSRPKADSNAKTTNRQVYEKKGETHITDIKKSEVYKSLSDLQKESIDGMVSLYEALGIDVYFFESTTNEKGQRIGKNGYFVPEDGSIHLDLYAGADGRGTILFTAGHELTHYIREKLPSQFKAFADIILDKLGQKSSVAGLIANKIKHLEANERTEGLTNEQIYDLAYEEVVADACEAMLADGKAFVEISQKVKEKDKGLWNAIKKFFTNLVAKIKSVYENLRPDSVEGRYVAEMLDTAEDLRSMWVEMLVEASEVGAVSEQLADAGIGFDSETKSVYSLRYSPARKDANGNVVDVVNVGKKEFNIESIAQLVSKATGRSIDDARKWVKSEVTIANIVMNNPEFLDFEADNRYEAIKKNSDYPQGTVDLSNLCPKREELTAMFDKLQKAYPNRLFTASDVAAMRQILAEEKITVSCGACFVEDRRQLLGEIADTYIGMWKEAVETGKPLQKTNASGNKITLKVTAALAKQYGLTKGADIMATDTYIPNQYDLTTYEGFKLLEKNHPIIAMGFNRYNNSRGQQAGRLIEGRAEYNRQILGWTDAKVRSVNNNGGLRIFSFSDFEVVHLLDLVQVIIDCAARGVKIQGYTKIPSFARLVRNTGIKLNRSLIPKGATGIKTVNGKQVLDIDMVEGIDINDENFLDESDNPDVGNIIIGINPTQIGIAMLDDFIDYIIPFHTNKSKEICKQLGVGEWVNYKESQHDKDIATGKASKKNVNIYTQVINKYHPKNKVEFVDAFLKECKKQGKIPRYAEFLNKEYKADGAYKDEYGAFDYTYREGYHKFLVDFKMFDKQGNILPQGNIVPQLDDKFMAELLKADVTKKQTYEFPQEVYDRLDKEFGEGKIKASDRATDRTSYAPTFYSHMGKVIDDIKIAKMGAGGVVSYLKGKGVKAEEIKWSGIEAFLEGKKSVTKEELQEFVAGSQLTIEEKLGEGGASITLERSRYGDDSWDVMRGGEILDTYSWNEDSGLYESDETGGGFSTKERVLEYFKEKYGSGDTRWEQYKLAGGENYRELVFKMPNSTYSNDAMKAHWGNDAEGVLAHARIQDFTTTDGKKMLFVEEIQSDWHNEGHLQGYRKEYKLSDFEIREESGQYRLFAKGERTDHSMQKKANSHRSQEEIISELIRRFEYDEKTIGKMKADDAPFRTTYHEYVLKRLLRMAAEEGYDSIGWTPSDIQSERWSDEYAEGYRIEYDQDIPKFLRKYGKKWGATVGKTMLDQGLSHGTDIELLKQHLAFWQNELSSQSVYSHNSPEFIRSQIEYTEEEIRKAQGTGETVWSMDIPDSMKNSVLYEGQAKFSDRVSNQELAQMDDTALYIKNTPKANYIGMIFNGTKTEETRSRRTLDAFIGKDFYVTDGKYVYGSVVLGEPHQYTEEEFHKIENQKKHRVPKGDEYDVKPGGTKWAYPIESYNKFDKPKKLSDSTEYKNSFQARQVLYSDRGNGYDGYSMSNNARYAYANGEMPMSKWSKANIVDAVSEINSDIDISKLNLDTLKKKFLRRSSWHHTSMHYNVTDFYSIREDYVVGLTQSDVDKLAKEQTSTPKAKRDTINDERVDEAYAKVLAIVESGILKTENSAVKRLVSGKGFEDVYQKAVELIRRRDSAKVEQWRKLPPDHYRQEYVNLYDTDIEGYIKKMYADKKLSRNSTMFKTIASHFGKDDTIVYQDRPTDSVSNRSLLANALESVAQNDIERNKLNEYKSKIFLIESEQAKLAELRSKIKELSFAKGERDTKALNKLQFEANQTANRINTYDRQLLNLESTKALKGVLEREKQMAYKRAEQRGKEALKAQREKDRERNAKTQRELLTRYQESRKKGIEGRKKTELRYKIKKVVNELNQYLKGTKEKHVPIQLQRPVAEALRVVNMDTVGAEQRIAHKRELMRIAAAKGNMDKVTKLAKEIDHIQEMGENLAAKLDRLKTAYDSILQSDDPLVANAHDEVISNTIATVIKDVGDTPIRDMSLAQLEAVYDMYKMVLANIRKANEAHASEKREEISTIANGVIAELNEQKQKSPYTTKVGETISAFGWNNLKPVYAFERIGSLNLTKVFNRVLDAEGVWATDMREAEAYRIEQQEKYNFKSFDFEKKYEFTSTSGDKFELNLGEIMALYAWAKDDDAKTHLFGDGFQFDPKKKVVKKKGLVKLTRYFKDATSYKLSQEILDKITATMTQEQRDFADAMQDYLANTMGEKGNEVSLALYEIKLFKNKVYFPLKVSHQYLAVAKEQAEGKVRVKNKGFTNERKKNAKNTVVLSSFMDVWSDHVNEMSMYHAFTLPLEDFRRVIGYNAPSVSDETSAVSVRGELFNAHGEAAEKYIDQLFDDINGGAKSDPRETFAKSLISKFKKASVIASWSVTAQQPTAIARATALVNPKYFVGKKVNKGKIKEKWETMKKYAPVCIIKEMGSFDTGTGVGAVEWLKGEKTWKDYVDGFLGWAPEFADKVTWIAIWNAVERETVHKHKNLAPNSEEFLNAVGERFTEVIRKTQVYDSTLARSANMRSKGAFMSMATAFLAEATTSLNMLGNAFIKGNKKEIARTLGALVGTVVLNSAIVSIIYAMRDDDEDETFVEKYLSRFVTEVVDGVNPLTYIPIVKDVWSAAQGFDIERADMTLVTNLFDSVQQVITVLSKDTSNMDDEELAEYYKSVADAWLSVGDNITALFGMPVKNIRRDINGIINLIETLGRDQETTAGSLGDVIWGDLKDSIPIVGWLPDDSRGDKLYDAIMDGDTDYVKRLKEYYKTDSAYHSAIRKALRENDPRIKEAAQALIDEDYDLYGDIIDDIVGEGYFVEKDIVSAIESEAKELTEDEEETTTEGKDKAESRYKTEYVVNAYLDGDTYTAAEMREDIINTAVANGKSREQAEKDFNSSFRTKVGNMYKDGEISRSTASDMITNYGGYDSNETYWKLKELDFRIANGEDADYSKYTDFREAVKTGYNLKAVINEYLSHGVEKKDLASQITSYFKPLYIGMSNYERASLKGYLLNAYVLLGYKRSEKSKDIDKWLEG